jgi:hypothetical protein
LVTLTDGVGNRRDILLGQHGTKESRVEYARVIACMWDTSAGNRQEISGVGAEDCRGMGFARILASRPPATQ